MAEELDIKEVWKKSKERADPSSLNINFIEKKETKTTLYWIKIILWIEFWINIALLPVFLFYLVNRKDHPAFIITYVGITVIYLIYYQFLIRKINQFSYDGNVIQSLKNVYGYLRFFLLHYKVMIWISIIFGVSYEFTRGENKAVFDKVIADGELAVFVAIQLVIFALIGGLITLFIHLIYGRKIKRLKTTIEDLKSDD